MTLFRTALLAAALGGTGLLAPGHARAQPVDGLYLGAGAGYNLLQDMTTTVDAGSSSGGGVAASVPMKVKWGGGYAVTGAVGWGFGNGVRLELEGSYRSVGQGHSDAGSGGRQTQAGVMGNALYDIDVGLGWVSPYVGVGIGYQAVSWDHVTGEGPGSAALDIDQTLGAFAYQFIVGVAFPVDQVPGLSVTAEYRYLNLAGSRNYHTDSGARVHVDDDANHSILVGLRYALQAPEEQVAVAPPVGGPSPAAPAPVPAAASLPARTYLVFFDWGSASLTQRARDVIAEAVRNSASVPHTRIEVTGHADRSGGAQGNMTLSRRRAEVVAKELQHWGVPSTAIDIHAEGDARLLVPTVAGVRQPENRRVEIVYH